MSIMPEGGWEEVNSEQRTDADQRTPSVYPAQVGYTPGTSYLMCKICDRGALFPKKVFRLSGPAVAIGYILLIPSILGMIFCGYILISINLATIPGASAQHTQSAFDASFRQNCAKSVQQINQSTGYYASQQLIEQYCECALSTYKETDSEAAATQTCRQRAQNGTLEALGTDVDAFYSDAPRNAQESAGSDLLHGVTSMFAIALGIAFFVGGLLGWLLVMRKRVLQCNVCGAVVNAS
jgi:hypothetical protein